MEFTGTLREINGTLIVTVPAKVIDILKLSKGDFCKFDVSKIETGSAEEDEEECEEEEMDANPLQHQRPMLLARPMAVDALVHELRKKRVI